MGDDGQNAPMVLYHLLVVATALAGFSGLHESTHFDVDLDFFPLPQRQLKQLLVSREIALVADVFLQTPPVGPHSFPFSSMTGCIFS